MMVQRAMDDRSRIGLIGEQAANIFLLQHDYQVIEQNWRCRTGEIDIIAQSEDILVFIEVRTRKHQGSYGSAIESVNLRKQQKIRAVGQVYLHFTRKHDQLIRFDVITVLLNKNDEVEQLEHIIDAF